MTLIRDIEAIKSLRNEFLNDFVINSDLTNILTEASGNNFLNSILLYDQYICFSLYQHFPKIQLNPHVFQCNLH